MKELEFREGLKHSNWYVDELVESSLVRHFEDGHQRHARLIFLGSSDRLEEVRGSFEQVMAEEEVQTTRLFGRKSCADRLIKASP